MAHSVLIVDDDALLCRMLTKTLQESGFEASFALTGEAGLEHYQRELPDLILLDVAMPGISGFDVAATIRELEQGTDRHTLIVILTAHARIFAVSVEFHAGIDSYLTKPVLPPDVVAHVQNLLAGNVPLER